MKKPTLFRLVLMSIALASFAHAYPLDGGESTDIQRLEGYRRAQAGLVKGRLLPTGAQLPLEHVRLRLADRPGFTLPEPDAGLSRSLRGFLGGDASRYGVVVLDLTDPDAPVFAAHQADRIQNPGSVGKIIVALGWFQALADVYPDDEGARLRVLRETQVTADEFIRWDSHTVPLWKDGDEKIRKRPLREGDVGNVYEYLDWMCSNSSNAAASTLIKELLLLVHFGADYPVDAEKAKAFLKETPKKELTELLARAIQAPLTRNGLDTEALRQGSFFTRHPKGIVPGTNSLATSRELLRFLVKMEQGLLVDAFSSLEIKRLLYLTDRRIRYASAPALAESAVYFKSGSLYSCKEEPGFECLKYHGNVKNYMNSAAVVETTGRNPDLHYLVVVLSNVLRRNSAVAHQTLATRIHRLLEKRHPIVATPEPEVAPEAEPAVAPDLEPDAPNEPSGPAPPAPTAAPAR